MSSRALRLIVAAVIVATALAATLFALMFFLVHCTENCEKPPLQTWQLLPAVVGLVATGLSATRVARGERAWPWLATGCVSYAIWVVLLDAAVAAS